VAAGIDKFVPAAMIIALPRSVSSWFPLLLLFCRSLRRGRAPKIVVVRDSMLFTNHDKIKNKSSRFIFFEDDDAYFTLRLCSHSRTCTHHSCLHEEDFCAADTYSSSVRHYPGDFQK